MAMEMVAAIISSGVGLDAPPARCPRTVRSIARGLVETFDNLSVKLRALSKLATKNNFGNVYYLWCQDVVKELDDPETTT